MAQSTNLGSGSFTNTFSGLDSEGKNSFPSGTPQISGNTGGQLATGFFSYVVGGDCGTFDEVDDLLELPISFFFHPNPTTELIAINSYTGPITKVEIYSSMYPKVER